MKNNKIKRVRVEDVVAYPRHNMSKKTKTNVCSQRTENQNFFAPLQTIDDIEEEDIIIDKTPKVTIPPITILKWKIEQLQEVCRKLKIKDFSMRKISIGIKLFCANKTDFDLVCESLNNSFQLEFFTYAAKNEKPYKAVLLGLDKTAIIKNRLIELGLKELDVKIVTRARENNNEKNYLHCVL